jgi:hypothetical protein
MMPPRVRAAFSANGLQARFDPAQAQRFDRDPIDMEKSRFLLL